MQQQKPFQEVLERLFVFVCLSYLTRSVTQLNRSLRSEAAKHATGYFTVLMALASLSA
jgi:hypothetical protein